MSTGLAISGLFDTQTERRKKKPIQRERWERLCRTLFEVLEGRPNEGPTPYVKAYATYRFRGRGSVLFRFFRVTLDRTLPENIILIEFCRPRDNDSLIEKIWEKGKEEGYELAPTGQPNMYHIRLSDG